MRRVCALAGKLAIGQIARNVQRRTVEQFRLMHSIVPKRQVAFIPTQQIATISGLDDVNMKDIRPVNVQMEKTPNPHSKKFILDLTILPETYGTGIHIDKEDKVGVNKSPLAKMLFKKVDFIKSIFLGKDFVTVTKGKEVQWHKIDMDIFTELMNFFMNPNNVAMSPESETTKSDTTILESDSEVVAAIKELVETRVRPSVQEDGGDIFFVGFDEKTGIVKVRLAGSCVGCPSSSVTLRNGVENMLMHYIPEVKGIEEVTEGGGEDGIDTTQKLSFKSEDENK